MMLHQSSPVALQCRMSALKGELMCTGQDRAAQILPTAVLRIRKFLRSQLSAFVGISAIRSRTWGT
jgi:hypothetical protein